MTARESVGFLHGDIPYLKMGQGPPLVMVQGLTGEHSVPSGFERSMVHRTAAPFASHFTVHAVNRKRGLEPGESMSDIARHLAGAIEHDLGEPVSLQGASTGGSVALQLAVDRPDLVRRLIIVAAAHTLGPAGRALQADMARLVRAGDATEAFARATEAMLPAGLRRPLWPVARLAGRAMRAEDPSDMLVTLDAEDVFDVGADLHRITAPVLVIGGTKDVFYPRELFEATAAGVPDGRLHLFDRWGHARTVASSATAQLTLGFLLAGLPPVGGTNQ